MDYQLVLTQLNTDLEDIERRRDLLSQEEELTRDAIASVEKLIEMRAPVSATPKRTQKIANVGTAVCPKCGFAATGDGVSTTGEKRYRCKSPTCQNRFGENPEMCPRCKARKHRGSCRRAPTRKAPKAECSYCHADLTMTGENEHTKGHVLTMLDEGMKITDVAARLKITVGRVSAYKNHAARRKIVHDETETEITPPLRAQNITETITQNPPISTMNSQRPNAVQRNGTKTHSCGKCVTRYVDGKPFFSAQPDCPEHGLGFGLPKNGMERKSEPVM